MENNKMENNEPNEKVMHLIGNRRKGLLSLIFSRLMIIVVLLLLQVLLYLSVFNWFREYLPHYTLFHAVFSAIMTIYLFNNRMDYTAKLTWLALIAIVPALGAFLLLYTQTNIGNRTVQKKVEARISESKEVLQQEEAVLDQLRGDAYGTEELYRYVNRSGCFPIYDRTEVTYYPLGEYKFAALLEEMEKAEHYIFLEYFIIDEGYMWGRMLDVLSRKAAEGVDVRVMYDGTCEITTLSHDYPQRLEALGIKAKMFSPVTPFLSTHYNYRDHRKILVIDGMVAFTGGVNLADEYINKRELFGHWKDVAVRLRGDAARSFTLLFLQMWNVTEENPDYSPCAETFASTDGPKTTQEGYGFVMPFGDCPLDEDKVGENVYMDILYRANSYVHIMSPYLILDGELERAILYAAQRGVDVKLILPGVPDKALPYALAKSHYRTLTDAGVKIFEYTPGFVHAKVFVSDDCRAVVGTINLDYRSLYHHFECAAYLYRVPCISEIEADFENTLAMCREVTDVTIRNEKMYYRLAGPLMKIIAPLM